MAVPYSLSLIKHTACTAFPHRAIPRSGDDLVRSVSVDVELPDGEEVLPRLHRPDDALVAHQHEGAVEHGHGVRRAAAPPGLGQPALDLARHVQVPHLPDDQRLVVQRQATLKPLVICRKVRIACDIPM